MFVYAFQGWLISHVGRPKLIELSKLMLKYAQLHWTTLNVRFLGVELSCNVKNRRSHNYVSKCCSYLQAGFVKLGQWLREGGIYKYNK